MIAAPAIRTAPTPLRVRCFDNWYDFDDSLIFLTPGGTGVVDGVAFVRDERPKPDWVGIFNHPVRRLQLKASPNRVFFAVGEPPTAQHRNFHQGQGPGTFVLSPDETLPPNLPDGRRHVLVPCMTRSWQVRRTIEELRHSRVTDKPRILSWITSNRTYLEGHRHRLAFLARLQQGLGFDLYGQGFAPIEDKWDGLAPYRYSIAFENTRAPNYFTEKLMDCFVAETMPIYYGSPAITQFFPAESMVIIDPDDPDIVAKIDEVTRSDLWLRRKDAILEAKRLVLEEYNIFTRLAKFIRDQSGQPEPERRMVIDIAALRAASPQ